MYRTTRKAKARRTIWRPEFQEGEAPPTWEPPELRCVIEITEFDSGQPVTHRVELHRSDRIDCFRVVVDGVEWKARMGLSRILAGIRKAMPRVSAKINERE